LEGSGRGQADETVGSSMTSVGQITDTNEFHESHG
jgi:hypothetical protein